MSPRPTEIDDFELERKTLKDQLRVSDNELHRLTQICRNKNVDTRTRAQKDLDKNREQAADDAPQNTSRQRDRQRATGNNDKNRQRAHDNELGDATADLTTDLQTRLCIDSTLSVGDETTPDIPCRKNLRCTSGFRLLSSMASNYTRHFLSEEFTLYKWPPASFQHDMHRQ